MTAPDFAWMLDVALEEARRGAREGGIPIGAALFGSDGTPLGLGRNRFVQDGDPSIHAEAEALRDAGPQSSYRDTILVTTLAPCEACSDPDPPDGHRLGSDRRLRDVPRRLGGAPRGRYPGDRSSVAGVHRVAR
jgi:hypothetical protein